tara:strand:- start:421 stop:609 length:189 start_codon:yes stop_codon:yes gene_type:complete
VIRRRKRRSAKRKNAQPGKAESVFVMVSQINKNFIFLLNLNNLKKSDFAHSLTIDNKNIFYV